MLFTEADIGRFVRYGGVTFEIKQINVNIEQMVIRQIFTGVELPYSYKEIIDKFDFVDKESLKSEKQMIIAGRKLIEQYRI